MLRDELLNEAARLIGTDRAEVYGSAKDNFTVIGQMWSAFLGVPVGPVQVAAMMAMMKIARLKVTPCHVDSWVDAAGYIALGGEIAIKHHRP